MITAIPRKAIRLDCAGALSAYIDSAYDAGESIPDYYLALLEIVRARPDVGKALESIRTLVALLRIRERECDTRRHNNGFARSIATIRVGHSFTDGKMWFFLREKERESLLQSVIVRRAGDSVRPLPVGELDPFMRTDGAELSIDPDGAPLSDYDDPTIALRAEVGRTIYVRADLFGFLLRRYPGAAWYAGKTDHDPIVFASRPGSVLALLMPVGGH